MVQEPPVKKPKGILRNRLSSSDAPMTPLSSASSPESAQSDPRVTRQNTRKNSLISSEARAVLEADHEHATKLKWDEANIYHNEQERWPTMKITEPKTPFQHHRPVELDLEFDEDGNPIYGNGPSDKHQDSEIPDFALGEPEEELPPPAAKSDSPKVVHVEENLDDAEDEEPGDEEKHRRFEEMRKKHYHEMGGIALHRSMDDEDEEEDDVDGDDDDEDDDDEDDDDEEDAEEGDKAAEGNGTTETQ